MKMEKVLRSALLLLLAAALCLSMAACTQTPAESSPASETQTPETAASEKASTEDDMPEDAGTGETPASDALSSALPVKTLRAKRVDENPYMAKSDANIHHDGYNTDSTDEVLPLGIYQNHPRHHMYSDNRHVFRITFFRCRSICYINFSGCIWLRA